MHRLAAGLLLFLLVSPALSATDLDAATSSAQADGALRPVLTLIVDGQVKLDATGGLLEFSTQTPMNDQLRAGLDKVVMGWRFKPVLADGIARAVTARMRITLIATKDDKNYRVNIDNVIFPGASATGASDVAVEDITGKTLAPPKYPEELLRRGVAGTVLLALRVNSAGKVEEVVAVQSSLNDIVGNPVALANAIRQLERSAKTSAARWTFNVPSRLANAPPSDLTVSVPVAYRVDGTRLVPGQWRTEVRGPRHDIDWLQGQAGVQRPGVSDVQEGEAIPVASAMRLETEVIGTAVL